MLRGRKWRGPMMRFGSSCAGLPHGVRSRHWEMGMLCAGNIVHTRVLHSRTYIVPEGQSVGVAPAGGTYRATLAPTPYHDIISQAPYFQWSKLQAWWPALCGHAFCYEHACMVRSPSMCGMPFVVLSESFQKQIKNRCFSLLFLPFL